MEELKPLNLCRVFSETTRVIKSHRRTFLGLAILFLFPSSLIAAMYSLTVKSPTQDTNPVRIVLSVAYYLFALGFSPLAIGSITYTVLHGFNGEPVKLKEAVKSITASYFPLLATQLAFQFIIFVIVFGFVLLVTVCMITTGLLGVATSASPYLIGLAVATLFCVMLYVQVNWMLFGAIVVAESSRGFAALKRSKALMKGKRGLGLCVSLVLGLIYLLVSWNSHFITEHAASWGVASRPSVAADWHHFFLTLEFLLTVFSSMVFRLYTAITSSVLYVDCKAIEKSDGEKSDEYVSLLGGNDKVATIV